MELLELHFKFEASMNLDHYRLEVSYPGFCLEFLSLLHK